MHLKTMKIQFYNKRNLIESTKTDDYIIVFVRNITLGMLSWKAAFAFQSVHIYSQMDSSVSMFNQALHDRVCVYLSAWQALSNMERENDSDQSNGKCVVRTSKEREAATGKKVQVIAEIANNKSPTAKMLIFIKPIPGS